jgi:hypothetical protein
MCFIVCLFDSFQQAPTSSSSSLSPNMASSSSFDVKVDNDLDTSIAEITQIAISEIMMSTGCQVCIFN